MHYKLGLSFKEIFYRIFSRSVNHLNDNCLNLRGPTRIAYEVLSYLVETTYRSGKINVLKIVLFSTLHFQFSYLLFISYTYYSSFCKLINTNRHVHKCECVLIWCCNLNITQDIRSSRFESTVFLSFSFVQCTFCRLIAFDS